MTRKSFFVGGLLTLILTAAVVGGSFAIFTDTESTHVRFEAGNINIALSGEVNEKLYLNPEGFEDWKPGDYEEFGLTITNVGRNYAWIQVYIYETPPWTVGRSNFWDVAEWGVNHDGTWNDWVIGKDETVDLTLWVDFPQWVGNDYQNAQGDLLILVMANQARNKYPGYSCVALENKGTSAPWLPELDDEIEGIICYKPTGSTGELKVVLNAYGLTPGAYYQLDFTGGDTNNPIDAGCQLQDQYLAGMSGDLYTSGYWNWGTYLEGTCKAMNGGEGVWNYAGVYLIDAVQADTSGAISFEKTLTGLPGGSFTYQGIGAHVKEITGAHPGTAWTVILSEMDYLNFTIP
jgi:predicted ribosomally synthesized peptide with SipW-like signal peptide